MVSDQFMPSIFDSQTTRAPGLPIVSEQLLTVTMLLPRYPPVACTAHQLMLCASDIVADQPPEYCEPQVSLNRCSAKSYRHRDRVMLFL